MVIQWSKNTLFTINKIKDFNINPKKDFETFITEQKGIAFYQVIDTKICPLNQRVVDNDSEFRIIIEPVEL